MRRGLLWARRRWWDFRHPTPIALRAIAREQGIAEPAWVTATLERRP